LKEISNEMEGRIEKKYINDFVNVTINCFFLLFIHDFKLSIMIPHLHIFWN
jgi:hypothetical protein